ncbi:MAG TPA: acyltransferase [Burkholderiaceae bacterium]|nr:acyltransferase [Burkholderiaceae bacterium]
MTTSMHASPPLREPTGARRTVGWEDSRADWVDAAKGMGIVLVVIGHAIDGLTAAHLADPNDGWGAAYFAIYSFHMPLFFLLTGLFVSQRLDANPGAFVHDSLVRVAWPYLLWSVLQLAVIDMLGTLVNTPGALDAQRIVSLLWEPTSQFWFLQALLILHLLSAAALPRIGVLALLAFMVAARVVVEVVELPHLVALPARFGVFYALGVALGPHLLERFATRRAQWATAMAAAAIWLACSAPVFLAGLSHWSLAALPAAVAGTVAVLALATHQGADSLWCALGRASMTIYVLHVLFVAGTRITLHRVLGIDQPVVLLALACGAGIVGPWLLRDAVRRAGLGRALGLG